MDVFLDTNVLKELAGYTLMGLAVLFAVWQIRRGA